LHNGGTSRRCCKSPKKALGGELITQNMIILLAICAIKVSCNLFNGITKLYNFLKKWKGPIIINPEKPEKELTNSASYRPIGLMSCLSNLFEICLFTRIETFPRAQNIIAAHQFGFLENHGTIEQVNRSEIRSAFEPRLAWW